MQTPGFLRRSMRRSVRRKHHAEGVRSVGRWLACSTIKTKCTSGNVNIRHTMTSMLIFTVLFPQSHQLLNTPFTNDRDPRSDRSFRAPAQRARLHDMVRTQKHTVPRRCTAHFRANVVINFRSAAHRIKRLASGSDARVGFKRGRFTTALVRWSSSRAPIGQPVSMSAIAAW